MKLVIVLVFITIIGVYQVSTAPKAPKLKCYSCSDGECKKPKLKPVVCDDSAAYNETVNWATSVESFKDGDPLPKFKTDGAMSCMRLYKGNMDKRMCILKEFKICRAKLDLNNKALCGDRNSVACFVRCVQCDKNGCNAANTFLIAGYMWLRSLVAVLLIGIWYI